jgi:hypothetical protein
MDTHYPTLEEPATPEYVLAVFQGYHRLECDLREADPAFGLSMNTSVKEWQLQLWPDDLSWFVPWRRLGQWLNDTWKIDVTEKEWRARLLPAKQLRLGDICELIARRAKRPRIRPAQLLGGHCAAAGAFLTLRSLLADKGIKASAIRPSTPLLHLSRHHCYLLAEACIRLAPGSLAHEPYRLTWGRYFLGWSLLAAMLTGMVVMVLGAVLGRPWAMAVGAIPFMIVYAVAVIFGRAACGVIFAGMHTFRDLATAIASKSDP